MRTILKSGFRTFELVRGRTETDNVLAKTSLSRMSRAARLREICAQNARNVLALRTFLSEGQSLHGMSRLSDDEVIDRVAEYIGTRRAFLVEHRVSLRVPRVAEADEVVESSPMGAQEDAIPAEKTWIEIELVGEDDKPMPGMAYVVELPDGTKQEGTLDKDGRAYFGDLDPGEAKITWPDLDSGAVGEGSASMVGQDPRKPKPKSAAAAEEADGPEKTWIEIALVGEDGKACPNEPYWIKLTDGSIREGRLDENGLARFTRIDAGDCDIRWPDLDRGAVEDKNGAPVRPPPREKTAGIILQAIGKKSGRAPDAETTWVEIALVGEDDRPQPDQRYWIKLPDGSVREGRVNAEGIARFDDLDPGQCEIRWPDFDDSGVASL